MSLSIVRCSAAAALLLGLPLTAQQRLTETVYPCDIPVRKAAEIWHACRAIDALTGKPIAGCELLLIGENPTPVAEKFWSKRVAVADADGFVRIRSDDLQPKPEQAQRDRRGRPQRVRSEPMWLMLRAPGYGASVVEGLVPSLVWPLSPAVDLPIELRDWQDLPVAGAGVGLCIGCGHTPDVAFATTDRSGRAVLRGVDPNNAVGDVYPVGKGLPLSDYGRPDWVPGDLPAVVRTGVGFDIHGKVVDAAGKPVANAFVGVKEIHRGPWSATGADGSFRFTASSLDNDLFVVVDEREVQFEHPDGESPYMLKLPAPVEGEQKQVVELPPLPAGQPVGVELRVAGSDGKPVGELELTVIGPLPLRRAIEESVFEGVANFERLPGSYEVRCRSLGYEAAVGRFEVAAGKPNQPKLTATPMPVVQVRAENIADLGSIYLRTPRGTREITGLFDDSGAAAVPVPAKDPFCFVVGNATGLRVVRATLAEAQQKPLVLKAHAPTQVRGQLVAADGKPAAAAVALVGRWDCLRSEGVFDLRQLDLAQRDDGRFDLASQQVGLSFVAVVPFDNQLRPRLLPVSLPYRGVDRQIDVGKVTLASQPALRILGADGKPLAAAAIGMLRVGWHNVRERGPAFAIDDAGGFLGPDPRAGDAIVVPAAPWDIELEAEDGQELVVDLPFRTVLTGSAPWTIQVPAGQLRLDIHDKNGEPVTARVFVGDRSVLVRGPTLLRQLPPGKLDLVLTAIDRKTLQTTVEVPASGRGELSVELPE